MTLLVAPASAQETKTTYDDHVMAILRQRCAACHSPDKKSGDLDVTNFTSLMLGGSSGSVIEPGDPDMSYLYSLITHEDEPVMPPGGKIPQAEIDLVKTWIEMGALENQGSRAVMRKPSAVAMGDNPLVRPEVVAQLPRTALEPVQHTTRNPVAASIATSPWAPIAAVAGKNQVLLYDTGSLQLIGVLPFPEGSVNVVRFSRSGSILLAAGGRAGSSGVAVLWDVATGERISSIGQELDAVLAADISPDHSLVALGGSGRVVNVYSTETGEIKFTHKKHTDWVTSLAFSTDGVLLATGDRNGGLQVWESWSGREYLTLKGHSAAINSICWRADSNILASASKDTSIRLWEMNNGSQIKTWNAHGGGASAIAFTRDGRILSTGVDRNTKLWGQDGAEQKAFAAFSDLALSVAWCDETSRAIAGDYTGEIRVWNPEDGNQLGTLSPNPLPLASRLEAAQTQAAQHSASLPDLQTKLQQATAAAAAVKTELDAAVAARTSAQSNFDQVQAAMIAANEKVSAEKTQLETCQQQMADCNAAKPLLAEALQKMIEAAEKLPGDETLQQQVQTLTERLKSLDEQMTSTQTTITQLQTAITESTSQVTATDEKVQQATQQLETAKASATDLETRLVPLAEVQNAAAAEYQAAQNATQQAQNEVNRWQGELDFIKQLEKFAQRLAAANEVASQRQQTLDEANQRLQDARSNVDSATQSVGEAQKSVAEIEAEIRAARKIDQ